MKELFECIAADNVNDFENIINKLVLDDENSEGKEMTLQL